MKVEVGESICYSYLRHVKRCWLVQANWKLSENWTKRTSDEELQEMFLNMRDIFDVDGRVFGKNTADQFMKQGEIDVIGIDQKGDIHALDISFHENGLQFPGSTDETVLKKMLRTYMLLCRYSPCGVNFHIYFASPKVNRRDQRPLRDAFCKLRAELPGADWNLIINNDFTNQVVRDTLEKAARVADTSELFMRASKLLNLCGMLKHDTAVRGGPVEP